MPTQCRWRNACEYTPRAWRKTTFAEGATASAHQDPVLFLLEGCGLRQFPGRRIFRGPGPRSGELAFFSGRTGHVPLP